MSIAKAWDLHDETDVTYTDGHTSSVDDDQITDDNNNVYNDITTISLSWLNNDGERHSESYTAAQFQRFAERW